MSLEDLAKEIATNHVDELVRRSQSCCAEIKES